MRARESSTGSRPPWTKLGRDQRGRRRSRFRRPSGSVLATRPYLQVVPSVALRVPGDGARFRRTRKAWAPGGRSRPRSGRRQLDREPDDAELSRAIVRGGPYGWLAGSSRGVRAPARSWLRAAPAHGHTVERSASRSGLSQSESCSRPPRAPPSCRTARTGTRQGARSFNVDRPTRRWRTWCTRERRIGAGRKGRKSAGSDDEPAGASAGECLRSCDQLACGHLDGFTSEAAARSTVRTSPRHGRSPRERLADHAKSRGTRRTAVGLQGGKRLSRGAP